MSAPRIHSLLLAALIAAAPLAQAAPEEGPAPGAMPMHEMPRGGMPMMGAPMVGLPGLPGIELSEAQQDKLFQLHHQQAPAIYAQQKAARKATEALRALVGTPDYTPAKARDLAQSASRAHAELALLRAQAEHEFLTMLSEEQKKQLAEHRAGPEGGKRGGLPMAGPRGEEGPRERR